MTKRILIALRVADFPDPDCPCDIDRCSQCGMAVWHAHSSPKVTNIMCIACASDIVGPDTEIMPPTPEQMRAIRKATSS